MSKVRRILALSVAVAATAAVVDLETEAIAVTHDSLVSETPQHGLGWDVGTFGDGSARQVWDIKKGKTTDYMYGCGKGAMPDGSHKNIVAWTGLGNLVDSFNPVVNGAIFSCRPTADGEIIIAGGFTKVNGQPQAHLAKINAVTGALNLNFHPKIDGNVRIAIETHGKMIVGGGFEHIGNREQAALGSIDPVTGAYRNYLNDTITGHPHEQGDPLIGPNMLNGTVRGNKLAVAFDARRVNGQSRRQIAIWNLGATEARLAAFNPKILHNPGCGVNEQVVQDIVFGPGAKSLYAASRGGPNPGVCDSATRFSTRGTGRLVWMNETCNDTMTAVEYTGFASYWGGHHKCQEKTPDSLRVNSFGISVDNPGFSERNGFSAINPKNGNLFHYRSDEPRCLGQKVLTATVDGLWTGKDCPFNGSPFVFRAE